MRSANRSNANNAWYVNTSGNGNNNNANNGNYAAPDCVGHGREKARLQGGSRPTTGDAGSGGPEPERAEPMLGDASGPLAGLAASAGRLPEGWLFEALWEASWKCQRGVTWKRPVAHFALNRAEQCLRLEDEILGGRYECGDVKAFEVRRPKPRQIVAGRYRDRVVQRSLVDREVMDAMSKSFVRDNYACQEGKGTDDARERMKAHLHRHYRLHGADGWVLYFDVAGYYRSMPHAVAEAALAYRLSPQALELALQALSVYPGEVGYNPGSQLVQVLGLSVLDPLDHLLKESLGLPLYCRYMDDGVGIDVDREAQRERLRAVGVWLEERGMALNRRKSAVTPLRCGVRFLGFDFRLTETGRVLMTLPGAKVREYRRDMRRLAMAVRAGAVPISAADASVAGRVAHAAKGDSKRVPRELGRYWKSLTGDIKREDK